MVDLHLDVSAPHQHLVAVSLRVQPHLRAMRLRLPGWTPGSYLMRDYVRHLEGLTVEQQGRQLPCRRLEPACWLVEPDPDAGDLLIRYRVMATDLSVRTCHLDGDHGFLALAALVLEVEGERWAEHRLRCSLPPLWQVYVPLPQQSDGSWIAANFDQLVDSPMELGPHREHRFAVGDVMHRWVTWGGAPGAGDWLLQQFPSLLDDVAEVCRACCRLMAVEAPPCNGYLFVMHLVDEGYGGLEHDHSTVLVFGRRALGKPDGYRKLLQLVAHEYLHQWNVRRLRPAELSPIDYHQPPVVPSLWFAEGITSYVDQLLPLSAGLSTPDQLLEDLGEDLSRYLLTPGRSVQGLSASSEEAWVKLYRADAYAADSQVSYYLKGAVVALCLDLHLRRHGSALAPVLQCLWLDLGQWQRGYTEQDLIAAFTAAAPDLQALLPAWLHQVDDPHLHGYLQEVGLLLQPIVASTPWAGFSCRSDTSGVTAQRVWRGGPAERAGLMVGDEVLAIDGQRVRQGDQIGPLLRADAEQTLLICRRSQLRLLPLRCASPTVERYQLTRDPLASSETFERQQRWLRLWEPPW